MYIAFFPYVLLTLQNQFPEIIFLILAWIGVLIVTSASSITMYRLWFKQDEQRFADLPFLFGTYYFLFTIAKAYVTLSFLVLLYMELELALILNKINFFFILLELLPLMYLGLGIVLFSLSLSKRFPKLSKLNDTEFSNRIRLTIIVLLLIIESIFILLANSIEYISSILPFITIPSLIMIIYTFYLAWKHNVFDKVDPITLIVGFILILFTQILRPVTVRLFGESVFGAVIAEVSLIVSLIVVYFGLLGKGFKNKSNRGQQLITPLNNIKFSFFFLFLI